MTYPASSVEDWECDFGNLDCVFSEEGCLYYDGTWTIDFSNESGLANGNIIKKSRLTEARMTVCIILTTPFSFFNGSHFKNR